VEDLCFSSSQFIHVAESNDRQPPAHTQPADLLSDVEERISKSPPARPPPTAKNIAVGNADLWRESINFDFSIDDEAESEKRDESDEDHIWLESTESKIIASAAPTRAPITNITRESERGREVSPIPSSEIIEHIAPSGASPSALPSATDSLDIGEAGFLNTTRSWQIAVKAPSRSPPLAMPLSKGLMPELTDSDLGSPLNRIIHGIDHDQFDELRETGRARRTNNPIYGQREYKDPTDLTEQKAWIDRELDSKETEKKNKRVRSQTAKRFVGSLRSLKRAGTSKGTTHHSIKRLPVMQRNKSEALSRRNVPVRPTLKRVAQSTRQLDNRVTNSKKAQKPPPLPSVESFPLSALNFRRSTPSLPPRISDALIVSRPRRQTSSPLPECKTPKLVPRSDLVPPPAPLKDMRLPPLPNQPKLLIPKLYKNENEALGNENSGSYRSSQVSKSKLRRNSFSEPLLKLESLKPKYYDANGQPVKALIPITIW